MADPLPALRAAFERLERSSLEPALASLLEAWRASGGVPAIADAIDRLSETITRNEPPILGGKSAWYAAAHSKRPAALGRLLEALPEGADRAPRLRVLQLHPPDPRCATFARRWLDDATITSRSRASFFAEVLKLVAHTGDTRLAPFLATLTAPVLRAETVAEIAAALAAKAVPPLDHEATSMLARIDGILRKPAESSDTSADARELFAQVYADPDDDEARAVLADLLQQHGDPRGEFIALQLARAGTDRGPTVRERKLEQTWGRTWVGPLVSAVERDGVVFERGFVARCRYFGGRDGHIGAPEWSTITHIDVSPATASMTRTSPLLLSPQARSIRHVRGLAVEELPRLAKAHRPWQTVGWLLREWDRREPIENAAASFPNARTLVFSSPEGRGHLVEGREVVALVERWPRLETLELELAAPGYAAGIWPLLERLARLVVHSPMLTVTFDRPTATATIDIHRLGDDSVWFASTLARTFGVEHADVHADAHATFDGTHLRHRQKIVAISPIVAAARRENVALTIQGVPITAS